MAPRIIPPAPTAAQIAADPALTSTFVAKADAITTDWVVPTLGAGWVSYGAPYEVIRYRMHLGWLVCEGLAHNNSGGALTSANPLFSLPVGMRPRAVIPGMPFGPNLTEISSFGEVRVNSSIANGGFLSTLFSFVPSQ